MSSFSVAIWRRESERLGKLHVTNKYVEVYQLLEAVFKCHFWLKLKKSFYSTSRNLFETCSQTCSDGEQTIQLFDYKRLIPSSSFIRFCSEFSENTSTKMKVRITVIKIKWNKVVQKSNRWMLTVLNCSCYNRLGCSCREGWRSHSPRRKREGCWIFHQHRLWLQIQDVQPHH